MKKMSAEKIDAHLQKHTGAKKLSAAATKFDLKKTYTLIRPILFFASTFIALWKPKWSVELNNFIKGMDAYTGYKEPA